MFYKTVRKNEQLFKDVMDLTDAEFKILGYLVRGMSYQEMAELAEISVATVKYHTSQMMIKNNKDRRDELITEAASIALRVVTNGKN